jgi:hypothetical protein
VGAESPGHSANVPNDPPTPAQVEARLALLYQETGKVAAAFWDWRHKVITICSTTLVLTFAIVSWMYKQRLGGIAMSFPLAAGAGIALMCRGMDRRNGQIMAASYAVAKPLEQVLTSFAEPIPASMKLAIFTEIEKTREDTDHYPLKPKTYGHMLRIGYLVLACTLGALAVTALVLGIASPDTLRLAK